MMITMKAAVQYSMLLLLQLHLFCTQASFVPQAAFQYRIIGRPATSQTVSAATTTTTQRMLSPMDISEIVTTATSAASSSSTMWISTIDSDIANIPQNEFASVFTGGLIVMSGGLLSALIVGFILESRNLYASVVVDSYVDNDSLEDEEFWKNLSEEEQKKTRQVLDKIKQQKQQGLGLGVVDATSKVAVVVDTPLTKTTNVIEESALDAAVAAETTPAAAAAKEDSTKGGKKIDMFSDYGD